MNIAINAILYGLIGGGLVILGVVIGKNIHTKRIDEKINYLHHLADEIKDKNNTMVDNLSKVYQLNNPNTDEFTEFDAMLIDMWID